MYAIPTIRGVLTLVCAARSGGPEAPTWCLNGLDQITVAGARPITADAGTAYRMRAPAVMKDLDTVRVGAGTHRGHKAETTLKKRIAAA